MAGLQIVTARPCLPRRVGLWAGVFWALGLTGTGPMAAPAPSGVPVYRSLRDMLVVCDNLRSCSVIAVQQGRSDGIGNRNDNPPDDPTDAPPEASMSLTLQRSAGAGDVQLLALRFSASAMTSPRLQVDGRPLPALPWTRPDPDEPWTLDDAADIQRFIDAVARGSVLALATPRSSSAPRADKNPATAGSVAPRFPSISLSGWSAALLLVDDVQGRLDTQTAWLRKGSRPAAEVPDPPPLPVLPPPAPRPDALTPTDQSRLSAAVRRAEQAALRQASCDDDGQAPSDTVEPLDREHALVLLGCVRGAHHVTALAYRVLRHGQGPVERLQLPWLPPDPSRPAAAPRTLAVLTGGTYDPDTATLSHELQGRAAGDCGESARWRYDGSRFWLADLSRLDVCSGGTPGDFPVLWRSARPDAVPR